MSLVNVDVPGTSPDSARDISAYPDVITRWHAMLACVAALLVAMCLYPTTRQWFGGHAGAVLQVVAALAIICILYLVSLFALKRDSLVVDERYTIGSAVDTPIIVGYTETVILANRTYNTVDVSSRSYVHMPRSYNRHGGAQFTYSFWIFVGDPSPQAVKNRCILMRGDTRQYKYTRRQIATRPVWDDGTVGDRPSKRGHHSLTHDHKNRVLTTGVAIKCPRIAFGDSYDHLVVTLNTTDDLDATLDLSRDSHSAMGDTAVVGAAPYALSLIENRWAMMTFTFEDHIPINDFEDGILVNFFLNDVLYQSGAFSGMLRQNMDALHLFPGGGIAGTRIANLTYSNYAWGAPKVLSAYVKGVPKKRSLDPDTDSVGEPLYLSEYNKLDVYNV